MFLLTASNYDIIRYGHKFFTNRLYNKFFTTHLWKWHVSFKHVRITCFFNNMCFSHAFLIALIKNMILTCLNDTCHFYMWVVRNFLLLYVGCRKFPINQFLENFCPLGIGHILVFLPYLGFYYSFFLNDFENNLMILKII
jgi:hypothetical protein